LLPFRPPKNRIYRARTVNAAGAGFELGEGLGILSNRDRLLFSR
jgi:hypothetical protein